MKVYNFKGKFVIPVDYSLQSNFAENIIDAHITMRDSSIKFKWEILFCYVNEVLISDILLMVVSEEDSCLAALLETPSDIRLHACTLLEDVLDRAKDNLTELILKSVPKKHLNVFYDIMSGNHYLKINLKKLYKRSQNATV